MKEHANPSRTGSEERKGARRKGRKPTDRFPTADELAAALNQWRAELRGPDPWEMLLRFDRHARSLSGPEMLWRSSVARKPDVFAANRQWVSRVAWAQQRTRLDHRIIDRDRFNAALEAAHNDPDGSYQKLVDVHAEMHTQHSIMRRMRMIPVGTERFLPWHRVYVLRMEDLLRRKDPGLTIPYWDYANDQQRPDWVWQPPGVERNEAGAGTPSGSLPDPKTIEELLKTESTAPYFAFTDKLEGEAHNEVHLWCNGTISRILEASQDPIFWLLHANVDRLWDRWQLTHVLESEFLKLSGADRTLDPWTETTVDDVGDIIELGYYVTYA
jgi:hypothetical protein